MATENLEIEVIVNGKKAKVELDKVNNAIKETGQEAKKSGEMFKAMVGTATKGIIAIGVTLSGLILKAKALSSATFGLSDGMRAYAREISNVTGQSQEMIAGFIQTGKSAGMTNGQIKEMVSMATALGRAFPHESTESFIDNLSELHMTGENVGYVATILEGKFSDVELASMSVAEKMKALEEVAGGVNDKFQATAGSKIDVMFTRIGNAVSTLGTKVLNIIDSWGWLDTVNEGLTSIIDSLTDIQDLSKAGAERELLEVEKERLEVLKQYRQEAGEIAKSDLDWTTKRAKMENLLSRRELDRLNKKKQKLKEIINISKEEDIVTAKISKGWEDAITTQRKLNDAQVATKKQSKDTSTTMDNFYARSLDKMGTAITDFAIKGKNSFQDMATSIIAEWAKVKTAQALAGAGGVGGIIGTIGSFFGFHTGTPEVKHTGGFISLPSHHSGSLRTDERLAKLQVGEAVINRAGTAKNKEAIKAMNAGGTVGGGGNVTTAEINFNVQAIDSASFNNYLVGNRQTIENIINNSLSTNGSVRRTIKQVV